MESEKVDCKKLREDLEYKPKGFFAIGMTGLVVGVLMDYFIGVKIMYYVGIVLFLSLALLSNIEVGRIRKRIEKNCSDETGVGYGR